MQKARYNLCEYNIITLLLWQPYEHYHYAIADDICYIITGGKHKQALMPITTPDRWADGLAYLSQHFCSQNHSCEIGYASEEFKNFIVENYPEDYTYTSDRNHFDYLHRTEDLMNLAGRNYAPKRNHVNRFKRKYGENAELYNLEKEDFAKCKELMEKWNSHKIEESDQDEQKFFARQFLKNGLNILLDNSDYLDFDIAGLFIDGALEGFTIGSYLRDDTVQIHMEQANPNISGVYQYLNQAFLKLNYSSVPYVNREDDVGVEGLRQAKMSYYPLQLLKKYTIRQKD